MDWKCRDAVSSISRGASSHSVSASAQNTSPRSECRDQLDEPVHDLGVPCSRPNRRRLRFVIPMSRPWRSVNPRPCMKLSGANGVPPFTQCYISEYPYDSRLSLHYLCTNSFRVIDPIPKRLRNVRSTAPESAPSFMTNVTWSIIIIADSDVLSLFRRRACLTLSHLLTSQIVYVSHAE